MNTSHVGVVILHVEYAKVLITVAVVTVHPSGNRNLYYTDGSYNFDSTKVEPLCSGGHIVTIGVDTPVSNVTITCSP